MSASARAPSVDEALAAPPEPPACDACGVALSESDRDEDDDGPAGQGAYLWMRGDKVEIERVPLCASCASAIGMAALGRWEIEEEEG